MATITTIAGSDVISTSRTTINTNFANLNSDKMETSVLDTDTALTANSDAKVATQKAVKAYVDAGGNVNASETNKGIVEEATDAEVTAGTATGATGAKLFVTPAKLATQAFATSASVTSAVAFKQHTIGALDNALVKTYFNVQLLFILWTGDSEGALTTPFVNWRTENTGRFKPTPGGAMADAISTGATHLYLTTGFLKTGTADLVWTSTNIIILDFWAKLPASGTGDINMGFFDGVGGTDEVYNSSSEDRVAFVQRGSTGVLYATIAKGGTGVTNTDISSGVTVTNWNNYRIELDISNNALFYVNGTLKATLSGANLPSAGDVMLGFGRSDTSLFQVTAPTLSLQMNP